MAGLLGTVAIGFRYSGEGSFRYNYSDDRS